MNRTFICKVAITGVVLLSLSGCAREISSNTYKVGHIGEASFTYQGVVASARQVKVEEGEYLEQNSTGIALGAIAGGAGGSTLGNGSGQVAATVAGAVLGGIAGAFAEKGLKSQNAMEYAIRLNNGSMMTIVQGLDSQLQAGQHVLVMVSHDGRSRVVADNSSIQEIQPLDQNQPKRVMLVQRNDR